MTTIESSRPTVRPPGAGLLTWDTFSVLSWLRSLICGSAMHAAVYRSIVVALRGARPVTPKRIRRGGNTGSFDLVARTERQLVASGRATLSNA